MIRWRGDLLNGRWRIVQDHDDYWRVHDTTTANTLPGIHITRIDARRAAELEYYLALGVLVRQPDTPTTRTIENYHRLLDRHTRENW